MEDEDKNEVKFYGTTIDYLNGYTGKLNSISNQINFLAQPTYQASLLTAVTGIQTQLTSFSAITSCLPSATLLATTSPMFELSRQATIGIANLSQPLSISGLATTVGTNYKPWFDENITKGTILSTSAYTSLNLNDTSSVFATTIGAQNLSTLSIQSGLVKATELSVYAEKSLFTLTNTNIGSLISLGVEPKSFLTTSFVDLSKSYSGLIHSFETSPLSYTQINPTLTKLASVEYFSNANLLEAISVEEDVTTEEELLKNEIQYENEYSLNTYLPKIDSGLLKMWKGAVETFNSNNSDKVRQFTVSIRELFGHVMRILAPEDEINKWTSGTKMATDISFYDKGKPTRKAKLHFICRNISHEPFNLFVEKDIKATIGFIGIFQDGTHSIESGFTPHQLVAMKSKAETTLKFLLEIHFRTNN